MDLRLARWSCTQGSRRKVYRNRGWRREVVLLPPRSGENSTGAVGVLSSLGEVARRDAGLHRQEREVTSAELGMRRGSECMEPGGQHMGMEPVEYIAQAEECLAALQGVRSSPEARG